MNSKVDIVIPWVDGSDPLWNKEKEYWYSILNPDKKSNSNVRYQNWDNLKFLFRAIEKNMNWVNNIFLVTHGHIPSFLNVDAPKLRVVKHTDFIPAKYLPTFNANPIEMNVHRIDELSEYYIFFNDDMFPIMNISQDYYFKNGKICDEAIETPIIPVLFGDIAKFTWNMRALDISIINKHFDKREVQSRNPENWFNDNYGELRERNESLRYWNNFVGFRDPHVPCVLKKSTLEKLWELEPDLLEETCAAKFRNFSGVNHWLARYWQICEGDFNPRKTLGKSFVVTIDNCEEVAQVIKGQKEQMICINEDCTPEEFEKIKLVINKAFEELFPEKSSFEK